jgi:delta14-sterol reductase
MEDIVKPNLQSLAAHLQSRCSRADDGFPWNELVLLAGFYAIVSLLHYALPAYRCHGYACDWNGQALRYRLNGPLVLIAVAWGWWILSRSAPACASFAARRFWPTIGAANILGLVAAAWLMLSTEQAPAHRCITLDQKELRAKAAAGGMGAVSHFGASSPIAPSPPRNAAGHFFFGYEFNPRVGDVDIKMLLYILGAVGLEWNLLSAAALRGEQQPHAPLPNSLLLYGAMLTWFVTEYMLAEVVHLYTYDLFCEKLGFKLAWGCLFFYPFFYGVGVWSLVVAPAASAELSQETCAGIAATFVCGWCLTRGANLQKYVFKTTGGSLFGMGTETVPGTRLLCCGFWGLARHVNYCGEIIQSVALALPGFLAADSQYYRLLPWAYPLYYVAILFPRQMDDDDQMKAKYGKAFGEYVRRVPARIIPGVW